MANSVDPEETDHYEPSHLDLHCLQKYLYWSSGLKGLKQFGNNMAHDSVGSDQKSRFLVQ